MGTEGDIDGIEESSEAGNSRHSSNILQSADGSTRMAVVHEWVSARAGSEQVFEATAQAFPQADLYALSRDPGVRLDVGDRPITTTILDQSWLRDVRAVTLPLMPAAWRLLGSRRYDLVLTSHHALATSNRLVTSAGVHAAYVHTPARYVWTPQVDGRGAAPLLAPLRSLLKQKDRDNAKRLTSIAANSREVAARIEAFWDREARVIYPPVEVDYFSERPPKELDLPEDYILTLGRWVRYKNPTMAIEVAERLDCAVVIAGQGPLRGEILEAARSARVPVRVIEAPTRGEVRELLQRASALLFPAQEDFGIVPVEAMAAGTPVVALAKGGALETVVNGTTGILVEHHDSVEYAAGVEAARHLDPSLCTARAQEFSVTAFKRNMQAWIGQLVR